MEAAARHELSTWSVQPLYACVFGSAARRDGDTLSDIDLLLVHQPFPGDVPPRRRMPALAKQVARSAAHWLAQLSEQDAETWQRQVDDLHEQVLRWTGNPLQAVQISSYQWAAHQHSSLFAEIARDAIDVTGQMAAAPFARAESAE